MRFCERHIRFQSRENINLVLHLNFSGKERDSKGLGEANLYKQFPLSYQNKHILSIVSKICKIMKYQNCCHFVSFRSTRLPCVPHTMKGKKEILKKYGNANMLKDSAHLSKQVFHSRQNLQNSEVLEQMSLCVVQQYQSAACAAYHVCCTSRSKLLNFV